MTLNSLFAFIKEFVGWRESKQPIAFTILSQHQYRDGLLLRVNRESVTSRVNKAEVATYAWLPNDRNQSYLFLFLDSLMGMGVRNLSHRIQILSSDRQLTDDSVKVNIYLSENYYLGTNAQANAIVIKLILYCQNQHYESIDWNWEVESCRKQMMGVDFTDFTQEKARDDSRYQLDRFELRYSAPRNLNPVLIEKMIEVITPKPDPPRSRVIELLIIGSVLIAVVWLWVQ